MAVDATKERLDAAKTIAGETELILQIRQTTFSDGFKDSSADVYAHAIQTATRPSEDRGIKNTDLTFVVSALQCDSSGNLLEETLLTLKRGDQLVWEGGVEIEIVELHEVRPTGPTLLYERVVAGTRKAAAA